MAIDLKDKTFNPIDGRKFKVLDYFNPSDFATDGEGRGTFVKHDALLRVCKELFIILGRDVHIAQSPSEPNGMCATATVRYDLSPKTEEYEKQRKKVAEGELKEWECQHFSFQSSGDCYPANQPQGVGSNYFTAMAETRASGRALRFLLGVDFCTKEEISGPTQEQGFNDKDPISENTKSVIEKKFMGRHGVTLNQIRNLLKKTEKEMPSLDCLTVAEGATLMQKLSKKSWG
jgi:hypothetical protein